MGVVKFPKVARAIPPATSERPMDAVHRYFESYAAIYGHPSARIAAEHFLLWLRAQGFKVERLRSNE